LGFSQNELAAGGVFEAGLQNELAAGGAVSVGGAVSGGGGVSGGEGSYKQSYRRDTLSRTLSPETSSNQVADVVHGGGKLRWARCGHG
jgi:hypothetical protein